MDLDAPPLFMQKSLRAEGHFAGIATRAQFEAEAAIHSRDLLAEAGCYVYVGAFDAANKISEVLRRLLIA